MIGERLKRAREAAGFALRDLAEQVGVSHTMISKYEKNKVMPSSSQILKIAKALDVRMEYFFRPSKIKLEGVEFRKRSSLSVRNEKKLTVDIIEQAERWSELVEQYPNHPIMQFSIPKEIPRQIDALEDIDDIADLVREVWGIGFNPIPSMVDLLESHGILVINTDIPSENKFDGLSCSVSEYPIIAISSEYTGDRQRNTLAHELGHLLLDGRLPKHIDEEKACNYFAGAFLLPKSSIIQSLGQRRQTLELGELYLLKHEFGISMGSILYRAAQLGIISQGIAKQFFISFRQKGWHRKEPMEQYPKEKTYLFKQLVLRALAERYIGESKAAELLVMPIAKFHKERKLECADACFN